MNTFKIKALAILLGKVIFIILLVATNIFNVIYCILLKPGHDHIKSMFYKKGGQEEISFLNALQDYDRITHNCSAIILIGSILLLIKSKRYRWLGIAGIFTFLGLIYQLYIFGYL